MKHLFMDAVFLISNSIATANVRLTASDAACIDRRRPTTLAPLHLPLVRAAVKTDLTEEAYTTNYFE